MNVPLLGRINCPVLVVVLFEPDDGLAMLLLPRWFVMFRLLVVMLLLLLIIFELLFSVLLLLLLLLIARLELLRLLLLLLVSKCAALPGDTPMTCPPWPRVTELYGGGAGVAEGFAVLGGGNGGRALLDCRRYGLPYTALYLGSMLRPFWIRLF